MTAAARAVRRTFQHKERFLGLLLSRPVQAATYTVALSGADSNAGSAQAPFRTIQKCASTAVSGDTCRIRAGTYRETVTPAANNVIYEAEGTAVVTVSGADVVTG